MKIRKNRLMALAVIAGAAYLFNRETTKNPELMTNAKNKWEDVKGEFGKVVSETKDKASQALNDFEQGAGDYSGEAFEAAEQFKDEAAQTIDQVGDKAEDAADTLKDEAKKTWNDFN